MGNNNDLISRGVAKKIVSLMVCAPTIKIEAEHKIDELSAVNAALVRHGRWIEDRTDIVCGVCGARYKDEIVFMPNVYVNGKRYDGLEHCPHCGAKLDGGAA